ncbi:DNA cytosine methyltransferase [Polynucleobacter paneuropaeus]|jgi:DNA (cytosine-5)-methyltransferase 1|nr:DNA cytosine methyltransferase [Polynucleobacter paneuropaeus]MBT8553812.1 DNA cytosine methyltransferase [Polynucleobacter paneuropaeus]
MKKVAKTPKESQRDLFGNVKVKKYSKSAPRLIDLFAGIGGIRMGFELEGCETVFTSEWDESAQRTYEANFGDKPFGDITAVDEKTIPPFDILLAGFPCQPFSQAGLKKGLADTRGTLFFDVARIVNHHRPRVVFLENVKRFRTHDGGNTFQVVKDVLEGMGYSVYSEVLNAKDFGVPQNRERIYIIGVLGDVDFSFPTPPKTEVKLGDILEKKVDAKYTISDTLWAGHQRRKAEHIEKGNGFGYSLFNEKSKYTSTISARYYKDGSEILIEQKGKNPRKLTPREAARLQGFPDTFVLPASDTQTYKQFGNSVAVPVVNALAKEVLKTMKKINPKKVEHKKINVEKIKKEKVSAALKALET